MNKSKLTMWIGITLQSLAVFWISSFFVVYFVIKYLAAALCE